MAPSSSSDSAGGRSDASHRGSGRFGGGRLVVDVGADTAVTAADGRAADCRGGLLLL